MFTKKNNKFQDGNLPAKTDKYVGNAILSENINKEGARDDNLVGVVWSESKPDARTGY
jgi:hypothetical protein